MAKVFGEAGRYTSDEAARQRDKRLMVGVAVIGLLCFVEGATVSSLWAKLGLPGWLNFTVQCAGLVAVAVVVRWGFRQLNETEASEKKWQRGADGESAVGRILADFPDDFYVINDLSTPAGNLDHVVVGPTGVYVLDAKNWRGVVQADSRGELLLNGRPTDKNTIRIYTRRIMAVKETVCTLAPGTTTFFKGLLVFTAARVDAPWGKTKAVHCLREDQLWDYVVNHNGGKQLTPAEAETIAQAFLGMAHMDRDFTEKATATCVNRPSWVRPVAAQA